MIQIIPSEKRFTADHGWLLSRFSFSFAEYYDQSNREFGALRVFNDDLVQPGEGFGTHPHREMEIMSYVIEGTLAHQDSMGNRGTIRPGEVQVITAGTGIEHSEFNDPESTLPVHFLQIWFRPEQTGLTPSWKQREFAKADQLNRLLPVVSGHPAGNALHVHQDVTVYLSKLEAGKTLNFEQDGGRRMYVFVISGELTLNDTHAMATGDSARITEVSSMRFDTNNGAEFMFMDLA